MEKLTINDIAKLAGVSTATVSNFLNHNYGKMSAKTRAHVAKIITEHNYHPNSVARDLAKNDNKTIGVSIADITNPFSATVLSGISAVFNQAGYRIIFTNADNDQNTETSNILRLQAQNVAGIIIDPVNPDNPIYQTLSNNDIVMFDRQMETLTFDSVATNDTEAVEEMTKRMMIAGYDELYFVSWPLEKVSTRIKRYQGFLRATRYPDGTHLIPVPYPGQSESLVTFQTQIKRIMEQRGNKKVGFFTMNASVFVQLLQTMQHNNYTYPTNYGVATYEEFDWMTVMRPGISCIRQDSRRIRTDAAKLLKKKLETKEGGVPTTHIIPTTLIIRDSF